MDFAFTVLGNIKNTRDSSTITREGISPVCFLLVQSYAAEATDTLAERVQDLISQGKIFRLCNMLVAELQAQAFVLCIL